MIYAAQPLIAAWLDEHNIEAHCRLLTQPLRQKVPVSGFGTIHPRYDGSGLYDARFCRSIQGGGLSIL